MKKSNNNFNNYERNLIKRHINPKICVLSNGDDWEYLNHLIMKFNANITILGSNYNLLMQKENIKDYDLIIYQSTKNPLSPEDNYTYGMILSTPAEYYNKIISIIRTSKYEDGHIGINEIIATGNSLDNVVTEHKTAKDLREIIDIGLSNLEEYKKQHEENNNHIRRK